MKFLDLNITEKDIGKIVEITDTRYDSFHHNHKGLFRISSLNGPKDGPVRTMAYGVSNSEGGGYRLRYDGTWYDDGKLVLGVTKIFTKETNPEYFL